MAQEKNAYARLQEKVDSILASTAPQVVKDLYRSYHTVESLSQEELVKLVELLVSMGHKAEVPVYVPVKRIMDWKDGRFIVPTSKREADYWSIQRLMSSPGSTYPMPTRPEYAVIEDGATVTIPTKWQYWNVLLKLSNEYGYSVTKKAAGVFQQFVTLLSVKKLRIADDGETLLLDCIPDFRIYSQTANWDGRRFSDKVVKTMRAYKHKGEKDLEADKLFTGFSLPSWTIGNLDKLATEYGFEGMADLESHPIVKRKRFEWTKQTKQRELARSATPIENDPEIELYRSTVNGMTPFTHQVAGRQFIDWVLENQRGVIIADEVGLGKTFEAGSWAILRNKRMLVIPPTNLVLNWQNELRSMLGEDIKVITNRPGSEHERATLSILMMADHATKVALCKNMVLSIEGLTVDNTLTALGPYMAAVILPHSVMAKWQDEIATLIGASKDMCIIFDEAHKFKGQSSSVGRAYRNLADHIRYSNESNKVITMTATLVVKDILDVWTHVRMCYPYEWYSDRERFIRAYTNSLEQFYEDYSHLILFRTHQVVPDMPLYTWETALTRLPAVEQEKYNTIVAHLKKYLMQRFDGAPPMLVVYNYLKMAVGSLKAVHVAQSLKEQVTADAGSKSIIFAHHRSVMSALGAAFNVTPITGSTSKQKRDDIISAFNNGETSVIVASVQLATGWNAFANKVYFAELDWSWSTMAQAAGRAIRVNNPFKRITISMTAMTDTFEHWDEYGIEKGLWPVINRKKHMSWSIMNGFAVDEENGSMMSEIIGDLFPGVQFATNGSKVSNEDKDAIEKIIADIIGKNDAETDEAIRIMLDTPMKSGGIAQAFLDSGKGLLTTATIDGSPVTVLVCHADETGNINDMNLSLARTVDSDKLVVVSCFPALVQARYGFNVIGDWATTTYYDLKNRGKLLRVSPDKDVL